MLSRQFLDFLGLFQVHFFNLFKITLKYVTRVMTCIVREQSADIYHKREEDHHSLLRFELTFFARQALLVLHEFLNFILIFRCQTIAVHLS